MGMDMKEGQSGGRGRDFSKNIEKKSRWGPCRAGRRVCLLSSDFSFSFNILLLDGWLPLRMLYLEKQLERDGVTFQILWRVDHTSLPVCSSEAQLSVSRTPSENSREDPKLEMGSAPLVSHLT